MEFRFQIWGRDDVYSCASFDEDGGLIVYGDEFDRYPADFECRYSRPHNGPNAIC